MLTLTHYMGEGEDAQAGSPVVGEEISGCWSFFIYVITLFLLYGRLI